MERNCQRCGTSFTVTRATRVYCSRQCRDKYRPNDETRACQRCDVEFLPKTNQRYCGACGPPKRHQPYRYQRFKGSTCNRCGFVAKASCQLDIHHRDGNHANNEPTNLETICANCHRLESWTEKFPRTEPTQAERRAEEFERRVKQLSLTLPASTARKVAYKEFN